MQTELSKYLRLIATNLIKHWDTKILARKADDGNKSVLGRNEDKIYRWVSTERICSNLYARRASPDN